MLQAHRAQRLSGAAHLWLLPEAAVARVGAAVIPERLLSADELERYERLRLAPVRRRFLGARILCRHALSAYADVGPAEWRFAYGPHGRPELEPNVWGLRFNVSHTVGLIACVVTCSDTCGVDVELTPARPEAVALSEEHFAAAERADLNALAPGARAARFADLWVLKEAYTKALGVGLTRDLSSFTFDLRGPTITLGDPQREPAEARHWQFRLLRIGPQHTCAVALRRADRGARPLDVHPIDFAAYQRHERTLRRAPTSSNAARVVG
jgi:4'-phosphopantetheinyl transferase